MSPKVTRREFVKGAAALAPLALAANAQGQSPAKAVGDRFDVVIAGAGHNSLVTACYLAKAGFEVIVLEGRPQIGGGTKTAELTLKGFKHDVCSSAHGGIQGNPMLKELRLADYGLEYIYPDPVHHAPFPDGSYITLWQDFDRTVEEIAKYSKKDAATYRRMADEAAEFRKVHDDGFNRNLPLDYPQTRKPVPPVSLAWKRRMALSKWDVLHDAFEDERTITF